MKSRFLSRRLSAYKFSLTSAAMTLMLPLPFSSRLLESCYHGKALAETLENAAEETQSTAVMMKMMMVMLMMLLMYHLLRIVVGVCRR